MPSIEKIRDRLTHVERIITVTPEGGDGDEYEAALAAASPVVAARRPSPTTCVIMYSSGTTGHPKGSAAQPGQPGGPRPERGHVHLR